MNERTGEIQKPTTSGQGRAGLLLLMVIACLGGLGWLTLVPREPAYHGKPLSFWLTRATDGSVSLLDRDEPKTIECREAVRTIGTNAIPPLLRILSANDSAIRRAAMDLVSRQRYVRIPIKSVDEQKDRAQAGFYLLGDLASNAVPGLIEIFLNSPSEYSKHIAENALMQLYPAKCVAVPYWVAAERRAQWYIDAGMVQSESRNTSNALLAFSQAIRLEPTNVTAYCSRGDSKLGLQDFPGARLDFERAMDLSQSNWTAILGRGLCNFSLKDFKGAEADFTKALNVESNDWTAYSYRGLARANLRDLDAALADLNKAIELASFDATSYQYRAMVYGARAEFELALADAAQSLIRDDKDATTWALHSQLQCALKNYPAAVSDADKAIRLAPKDPTAYAARATAYLLMNEFAASTADLDAALKLDPKNARAFLARGVLRVKRGGEDVAALADLEHAAELAPQAPETHGMLGLFQYKLLKWEPALANCRKALELGPQVSASGYYAYIWLIRAQSGEVNAANGELKTYLASLDSTKTNEWGAVTARFFSGSLRESDFLGLATTTAKRPSAVTSQICESLYYAAMKRKLAGDIPGALELLQKCLDTKEDNSMAYMNACVEMHALEAP